MWPHVVRRDTNGCVGRFRLRRGKIYKLKSTQQEDEEHEGLAYLNPLAIRRGEDDGNGLCWIGVVVRGGSRVVCWIITRTLFSSQLVLLRQGQ